MELDRQPVIMQGKAAEVWMAFCLRGMGILNAMEARAMRSYEDAAAPKEGNFLEGSSQK
jgi:hypothetical protein